MSLWIVVQLILKTAEFVRAEGGQAEVMLKVQQSQNPNFGFLFEGDACHPYYKWLCENLEVWFGSFIRLANKDPAYARLSTPRQKKNSFQQTLISMLVTEHLS